MAMHNAFQINVKIDKFFLLYLTKSFLLNIFEYENKSRINIKIHLN